MDFKFERPQENKITERPIAYCNKAIHWIIYFLVFFIPLFFLTDTVDFFDYNKQYLIWVMVFSAVIIWLLRMLILEKKMVWKRTPLDAPILIFLAANVLIAIFSIDKYLAFWGTYGVFHESLLNILAMIVLYFLITNNF